MTIAILAGDVGVGHKFATKVAQSHREALGFVEYLQPSRILANTLNVRNIPAPRYVDEDKTIELIYKHDITTVVLAWWPYIVKKLHKLPGVRVINTHPSYLPFNRGKYPFYWAIREGTPFGATIHNVNDGVDTGDILWRKEIVVRPEDTGESLWLRSREATLQLLNEHILDIINNNFPQALPQDNEKATTHHSKDFEMRPVQKGDVCDLMTFIDDCRARTFQNSRSGRRVEIDGKIYRIHLKLVEEE